jgi:hypothetical protein
MEQVNEIIQWRERTGKVLPYPYFDIVVGWGQPLTADDPWIAEREQGTNYTFLAAFADQGLLFHYTKYARQSVSIVLRNGIVENWGPYQKSPLGNGTTVTVMHKQAVLDSKFLAEVRQASNRTRNIVDLPGRHRVFGAPMDSFVHFTGSIKPWLRGGPPADRSNATKMLSTKHYWFWKLTELDEELKIGLNFTSHWASGIQRPPLGLFPVYGHILNASSNLLTPLEREYPSSQDASI